MRRLSYLIILILFAGCSKGKQKKSTADMSDEFAPGKKLAEVTNKKLDEASGLACSISNPGMLWTHADSGNDAEVYLIDQEAKIRQVFKLGDVKNRDWEDITIGPGPDPGKNYLYVADIGDNYVAHKHKRIYRFEEPVFKADEKKVTITDFDTITFELSGSQKDTETIVIDPSTKDLYVISKRENPVYLYKLPYPYSTKDNLVAEQVMSMPFTYIVAGSVSSDGKEIVIKSYNHIYYWDNSASLPLVEALKKTPVEIPYVTEPQGEAIAWATDKSGFYTISERTKGKNTYLFFYERKK